jgi:Skp family chaperone for outer membrane proteins
MRNVLKTIVPGLLLFSLLSGTGWAQGRLATVDLTKVFDGYWKKKQAEAVIKETKEDLTKGLNDLRDEYKKATEDYQTVLGSANDSAVSSEEREKRKKAAENALKHLKDLEEDIRQYQRQADANVSGQIQRITENMLAEIRNVVTAKAKANNYSMVIDTAARSVNNTPVVLYTNNENDITDAVLSQLNATAPPEAASTDTKPSTKKDEKPGSETK